MPRPRRSPEYLRPPRVNRRPHMRRLPIRVIVVQCIHCRWWVSSDWPARPRRILCRHCGGRTFAPTLEIKKAERTTVSRVWMVVYAVPVERVELPPL